MRSYEDTMKKVLEELKANPDKEVGDVLIDLVHDFGITNKVFRQVSLTLQAMERESK